MEKWKNMTNAELRDAIRHIVNTSSSEEQVNERLSMEIQYPYRVAVSYSDSAILGRMGSFHAHGHGGMVLC